ncbi:hypothetical protein BB559_005594 [Furculomyces boomerangus]|uniref:sn-1-specific diacylglycerol lipase n=1 Tax=Furculomyces boomerangus TaxID=61424 RepID=A0A2T9Y7U7_9FUNG|nr:hypothetical protein BB559_005594 [Furculomyces boomerangus]
MSEEVLLINRNSCVSDHLDFAGTVDVLLESISFNSGIIKYYVKVSIGGKSGRTSPLQGRPIQLCEKFSFEITEWEKLHGTLTVKVYESIILFPDRKVGHGEIKISDLLNYPTSFTSYIDLNRKLESIVPKELVFIQDTRLTLENTLKLRVGYNFQKPAPVKTIMNNPLRIIDTVRFPRKNHSVTFKRTTDIITNRISIPETSTEKTKHYSSSVVNTCILDSDNFKVIPNMKKNSDKNQEKPKSIAYNNPCVFPSGDGHLSSNTLVVEMCRIYKMSIIIQESGGSENSNKLMCRDHDTCRKGPVSEPKSILKKDRNLKSKSKVSMFSQSFHLKRTKTGLGFFKSRKQLTSDKIHYSEDELKFRKVIDEETFLDSTLNVEHSTFWKLFKICESLKVYFKHSSLSRLEVIRACVILYRYHNDINYRSARVSDKSFLPVKSAGLELPAYYSLFALAVYGTGLMMKTSKGVKKLEANTNKSYLKNVLTYLDMKKENMLGYNFLDDKVYIPGFFVAYDEKYNSMVLSIRGTANMDDLVSDLSVENVPWEGGYIHKGVKLMAYWLFINVLPHVLSHAKKRKVVNIFFVGHSLGGAVATALNLMIKVYLEKIINNGVSLSGYRFVTFSFGGPACISKNLCDKFDHPKNSNSLESVLTPAFSIYSFVHNRDVVPSVSLGTVLDTHEILCPALKGANTFFDNVALKFKKHHEVRKAITKKHITLGNICKDIVVSDKNSRPSIPGKIFHIRSKNIKAFGSDETEISRIVTSMINKVIEKNNSDDKPNKPCVKSPTCAKSPIYTISNMLVVQNESTQVKNNKNNNLCHTNNPYHANNPQHTNNTCHTRSSSQTSNSSRTSNPSHNHNLQHTSNPSHNRSSSQTRNPHHNNNPCHTSNPCHTNNPQHTSNSCHTSNPHHNNNPCHASNPHHNNNPCHASNPHHNNNPCHASNPHHNNNPCHASNPHHNNNPCHTSNPCHTRSSSQTSNSSSTSNSFHNRNPYHSDKNNYNGTFVYRIPAESLQVIEFSNAMISDHSMDLYHNSLVSAINTCRY